jgi:hypothetical protein
MSSNITTFEVCVLVRKQGAYHFSHYLGMYLHDQITRTFHFDRRTHKQAVKAGEKRGRVLSCQKVNVDKMRGDASMFMPKYGESNPYPDAIAMDELIWQHKPMIRAERIQNQIKDKKELT